MDTEVFRDATRAAGVPSGVLHVRAFGMQSYGATVEAMREFTWSRDEMVGDELWLVEHPDVFTLGQAGRIEHVLSPGEIPVVRSDRGGQVTFHGPGQLLAYALVDLRRARRGVRGLVHALEQSVIDILLPVGLSASRRPGAPGVYLNGAKVASLGLRVSRGRTYHGLAINVRVNLDPFSWIDPCGFPGLAVTRLSDHGVSWTVGEAGSRFATAFAAQLQRQIVFEPASDLRDELLAG